MKGMWIGLCAAVSITALHAAPLSGAASEWQFTGHAEGSATPACDLQVQGSVLDAAGADVQLDCNADQAFIGNVQLALPTAALRQRRVMVMAELHSDAALLSSLWLKTTHDGQTVMFEDDAEQTLFGDSAADGWQSRQLTIPVDVTASQLRLGVLLQGRGKLVLRNVRVVVSQPGAMSPAALQYLDDALAILKQQTQERHDLHWQALEPQMRVLSSGAQTTAEVYPAIRYALALLGDRRNLLLTPDIARALRTGSQTQNSQRQETTGVTRNLSLSDGAQLVLANAPILRTAQNTPTLTDRLATP